MAKSPTEQIRDVERDVIALQSEWEYLKKTSQDASVLSKEHNQRLGDLQQSNAVMAQRLNELAIRLDRAGLVETELTATRERLAVLTSRFDEFRKQYDESDRRRFTLIGLIAGATLSLVVQGIVSWQLRK